MKRKRWTQKEIDFLKQNYKTIKYNEMAKRLERSYNSVGIKVSKLNLKLTKKELKQKWKELYKNNKINKPNLWTQEEIGFLKRECKKIEYKEIAKKLNRTYESINLKASKLRLKSKHFWTQKDINFLKQNYHKLLVNNIAKKLNKNKMSIHQKASKLRLKSKHFWTKQEKDFFKNNYKILTKEDIAKKLGRSYRSVFDMAHKLKLLNGKRKTEYNFTKEQLYNLYINKKLSTVKIAKLLKCYTSTIFNALKRFNIPIRTKSEALKGRIVTWGTKMSETRTRLFKEGKLKPPLAGFKKNDPRFTKEWFKKLFKSMDIKPNNPETVLIKLFKQLNLPYKYVGDGNFWITKFNPDFINCNGQKKFIEHFGDYWHNLPKAKIRDKLRLQTYSKYGYKTMVIWEHELKSNQYGKQLSIKELINKIQQFDKL